MTIDRTGKYWKASRFVDLWEYLDLAADYRRLFQFTCNCGSLLFRLNADSVQACVEATCACCGIVKRLRDSEEQWQSAQPKKVKCPCGSDVFEVGVGIHVAEGGGDGWTILGERCSACGTLGYAANRYDTTARGAPGTISSFLDLKAAHEISRGYGLHIYEVIYYSGAGDPGGSGRDAIYLVSAVDYDDALNLADSYLSHWDKKGERPLADVVHEIGIVLLNVSDRRLLRGPYFEHAIQFGVRSWKRSAKTNEWSFHREGIANPHGKEKPE